MNLTEQPDYVTWEPTHYVFVEKTGPFQQTAPACWRELHTQRPNAATGFFAQYKLGANPVYRAGARVPGPVAPAPGQRYECFAGGWYARFTLTGPYSLLPEACGRVFDIVARTGLAVRDGWYLENYVNDPSVTPEDRLVTEILIPVSRS